MTSTGTTTPTTALADAWPLAGLRVVEGDLELRYPDDALLVELARVAVRGVHEPDRMPFTFPWTRATPAELVPRFLAYHWGLRSNVSPAGWTIELAVLLDGEPVGVQSIFAKDFGVLRTAETGSWLALERQGRGVGTRMRRAICHLGFEGLGAEELTTAAFVDNAPSRGVTARIGYAPNGSRPVVREGEPVRLDQYALTRAAWLAGDRPDVEIHGLAPVLAQLGLDAGPAPEDAPPGAAPTV